MKGHSLSSLVIGLIASATLLLSTAWADQVIMKNGDRITGSIVKQDGKTITVKTVNFGVVTASWDQVASVSTDQPVNVVLKDGKTLLGTLTTSEGKVEVVARDVKLDVPPGEVMSIRDADEQRAYERLLRPGWGQLWAGTASIGFAGTSGNARTVTFTTGVNAARVTNTDKASLYFNAIKASALVNGRSAGTAQAVRGGLSDHRQFDPTLVRECVQRLRVRQVSKFLGPAIRPRGRPGLPCAEDGADPARPARRR